ncbi:hypothetical protein Thivi_0658 [Thiocystis violascens DSM 198]|uniref:Uncharacterized protein n=2 Tax=Thiocystis violascens TaxID=73141 RepID=I3Y6U4_THIV6|nr:hypothetical protein Thivi_0658 [Thiocystis violascens DSM 198]
MRIKQAFSGWWATGHPWPFKSHWYYWYTGRKSIAILSMIVSILVTTLCLTLALGCSIWGIVVAILLDSAGFWLTAVYVFVLRSSIPELAQGQMDALIATHLVLPMLFGLFVTRASTFLVAKALAIKAKGPGPALQHV